MEFDAAALITTIIGGGTAGLIAFLLLALYTGKQGVWVWGRELAETKAAYEQQLVDMKASAEVAIVEIRAERDAKARELNEWKQLALHNTGLLEQVSTRQKLPGGPP